MNAVTFSQFYDQIKRQKDRKLVFIIDEVEGLNPQIFGQFLHTIRNLYHFREEHSFKSIIKAQLAYYTKSIGISEGIYLVFVPNTVKLPALRPVPPGVIFSSKSMLYLLLLRQYTGLGEKIKLSFSTNFQKNNK